MEEKPKLNPYAILAIIGAIALILQGGWQLVLFLFLAYCFIAG